MEDEKHIDESWKESVASEKNKFQEERKSPEENPQGTSQESPAEDRESAPIQNEDSNQPSGELPEINFLSYITSLAYQAMIFMGETPSPITNRTEKNLQQAKFIIDTLVLLREKTAGNLKPKESDTLNAFLYELQMKYVETVQNGEKT